MRSRPDNPAAALVRCSDCVHFRRNTEGRSFNVDTGVYFMGRCAHGLHPDTPVNQFANRPRECVHYTTLKA